MMHTLNKQVIVPYCAKQMFMLVNDVEHYPHFLPGCRGSCIISHSATEMIASLDLAWQGIHKQFTTHNYLYPYERISMSLVDGPLRRLEGVWHFQPLGESACNVILELEFELTGKIFDKALQPVLQYVANMLVDAFCKRAHEQYGKPCLTS